MNNYYRAASWEKRIKFTTAISIIAGTGFIIYSPRFITFFALFLLIILPAFLMVRGYSFDGEKLIIHRLGWGKEIDVSHLRKVTSISEPIQLSSSLYDLFKMNALFAWTGSFRSPGLGNVQAYITRRDQCILLELATEKILVSPENTESFVNEAEHLTFVNRVVS